MYLIEWVIENLIDAFLVYPALTEMKRWEEEKREE